MLEQTQQDISKWAGMYYTHAEFWGNHFYPLLIESNGDLYLHETKLSYAFDSTTDTLSFSGQPVRGAKPTVRVKFSKGGDGKNRFSGVMYPQPGDGPGSFTGIQMLKTQTWGTPTGQIDLPLIGKIYIGDHTWVTMNDNNCWSVLGGGPQYYCNNRWKKIGNTQVYFPPEGRLINSIGEGNAQMTSCMGGTPSNFLGIPTYAGIVYGLHGVCHQMANRIMLGAGKLTVDGAEGYALSWVNYGAYGVRVPPPIFAILAPIVGPVGLVALLGYMAGINIAFGVQCANCGAPYPGPLMARDEEGAEDYERRLVSEVMKLHSSKRSDASPKNVLDMSAEDLMAIFEESHHLYMDELALYLDYKVGNSISAHKISNILEVYDEQGGLTEDIVREGVNNFPKSREALKEMAASVSFDLVLAAAKMNQSIIQTQQEVANLLTQIEYTKIFDYNPDMKVGLIDPNIMTSV